MSRQQLVFGQHAAEAMLKSHASQVLALRLAAGMRSPRQAELEALAAAAGVRVEIVERDELDRQTGGGNHQGVVLDCRQLPELGDDDLERILAAIDGPVFLLVLDGVQDPHNLGACLRTAAAAGVHALIAPRDGACGLTATVVKVASGAVGQVPFVRVTNLARCLRRLQQAGVWLVGTQHDADTSIYQVSLRGDLALLMGAEGRGLRRLTREACDHLAAIPMHSAHANLNVSVAAGVAIFEALRQRNE